MTSEGKMPGYWEWLPRMIRKSMAGSVSVQVTSWSPEAAKVAPGSRLAARSLTVSQRFIEATTSSEPNSLPLWKVTPSRSLMV